VGAWVRARGRAVPGDQRRFSSPQIFETSRTAGPTRWGGASGGASTTRTCARPTAPKSPC